MKQKSMLILIGILVFLTISIVLLAGQFRKNLSLQQQLRIKNQDLEKVSQANERLTELEHKIQALKQKERILNKIVPPNEKEPLSLIKSIILLGADIRLSLKSFTLVKEVAVTSSGSQSGDSRASAGQNQSEFKPLYLEMNFEATFPQLVSLLEKLRKLERLVDVVKIFIKRDAKIMPRQEITLKLVTYTAIAP